jgi:hypothetical protein
MKKARTVKQKVMGRPRTGIKPLMGFRADDMTRGAIVKWAENQPDTPTLSEAIRRLVEIGLANASPMKPKAAPPANAKRAEELAAKVIDGVMPPGTPTEERNVRRRKILEGPSTIRDVRIDRPKSR